MLGFKDYARVSERKRIMVIKQIKTYIKLKKLTIF